MKYEICVAANLDGTRAWSTIAWTDVRAYAEEIVTALSYTVGKVHVVLCDGKVIYER